MSDLDSLLKAKLESEVSRRYFLAGIARIGSLVALGPGVVAACTSVGESARPTGSAAASQAPGTPGPSLGGSLNFIGYSGEDAPNIAKPFLEKHGIKVYPTYIGSPDEPLTKFKTGGRGQMDIIADNKDFMRAMLSAGEELYLALDLSRIPNAAGLFPAFQNAAWLTKDGKMYGIPFIWGDEPCVYNPKKWTGVPARYTDFADPKFKGELVMVDDPVANTWLWGKSLGIPDPSRLTQQQLNDVIAEMKKTKPNVVTFAPTLGDQADVLIRGDASIAIGGWAYQIVLAEQKGVTLKSASPAIDGTYYWSDAYGIAVDAPNLDNAYAFIDYMIAPENNAALAMELGSAVTIAAAVDYLDEKNKALYDYSIAQQPGGGILGTQVVVPPARDEENVVGMSKWVEAWEEFKLS
jgi:spermidine/putrescine-binding protein